MTDISKKFALVCSQEHLNTLVTDYIIYGVDKNNLDKGVLEVYNVSSNEVLKKLTEMLAISVEKKIENDRRTNS